MNGKNVIQRSIVREIDGVPVLFDISYADNSVSSKGNTASYTKFYKVNAYPLSNTSLDRLIDKIYIDVADTKSGMAYELYTTPELTSLGFSKTLKNCLTSEFYVTSTSTESLVDAATSASKIKLSIKTIDGKTMNLDFKGGWE